jgi:hypothetical protein
MQSIRRFVVASVFAGLLAPLAQAGVSPEKAAVLCKAEAASRYAQGEQIARIKLKGIYGSAGLRKVRVQVLPAEGKAFMAVCEVNGRSGEVVSIEPQAKNGPAIAATGG